MPVPSTSVSLRSQFPRPQSHSDPSSLDLSLTQIPVPTISVSLRSQFHRPQSHSGPSSIGLSLTQIPVPSTSVSLRSQFPRSQSHSDPSSIGLSLTQIPVPSTSVSLRSQLLRPQSHSDPSSLDLSLTQIPVSLRFQSPPGPPFLVVPTPNSTRSPVPRGASAIRSQFYPASVPSIAVSTIRPPASPAPRSQRRSRPPAHLSGDSAAGGTVTDNKLEVLEAPL